MEGQNANPFLRDKLIKPHRVKNFHLIPAWITLFILLSATPGLGQSVIDISGKVMDREEETPLQGASVMLLADTVDNEVLDFTFSDQMGEFKLEMTESRDTAWLRIRHLGFQHITIPVYPEDTGELIAELGRTDSQLREVVVESDRPPITLRGDTTTFDLSTFIDSTEHNVEDILKKLPGIEVGEDGQVTVYGKAIEALLIEGDDLFGRSYTIGTRNIRAEYISHVQIFENYEENPVLRNVSMSESVALNLVLDENMGMELNGSVITGGGVGVKREGKWQLQSNIFSIPSGHKMIYLGSNGNTGRGYTMNEMNARYGGAIGNPGLRDNNMVVPRNQHISRFVNPGLPVWYVDNSRTLFNTVRSISRLSDRWRLSINGLLHHKNGQQFRTSEQSFSLRDDTYFLQTEQDHHHRNRIGDIDAHLDYMSQNKKTRFETYFKWAGTNRSNDIDLLQFENNGSTEQLTTLERESSREYFGSALLTTEAGENQVFQAQVKWSRFTKPQHLEGRNSDFPFYFNLQDKFNTLHQSLDYSQNRIETTGRYLYQRGKLGLNLEVQYEQIRSKMSNHSDLTDEHHSGEPDSFQVRKTNESVNTRIIGLNSRSRVQLNSKSHIQLNFQPGVIRHQNEDLDRQSDRAFYLAAASYQRDLTREWQLNMALTSSKQPLHSYMHFGSPYFRSLYSDVNPSYRGNQSEGQRVDISMRYRNILRHSGAHLRATYAFRENRWSNAFDFFGSIIASDPIYIKNSDRWSVSGGYNWFYSPLKTNIRLGSGYTASSGQSVVLGELTPTKQQNTHLSLRLESRIAHGLTAGLTHRFRHSAVKTDSGMSNNQSNSISHRTDLRFSYSDRGWRVVLTGTYHGSTGSGLSRARLFGSHLEVYRQIKLGEKDINLSLNATNLTNTKSFDTVAAGTEFYSRSGTRAVPFFFYLNIGFSIF
ncbi:MAG: hypothetical protein EA411_05025 [Saprospirales bacterium]|nr:MAG: hypothetical protein EA411_05025 [Saprospirales bacterium]